MPLMESPELPKEIYCLYDNFEGGVATITEIEHATRNNDFMPDTPVGIDLACLYSDEIEVIIESDETIKSLLDQKPADDSGRVERSRRIRVRRTAIVLSLIAFSGVPITKIA